MLDHLASASRLACCWVLALPLAAQVLCSGSLALGGTGNYIEIANHADLQPATAVTYEAWYLETARSSGSRILSKGDGWSCLTDRTFDLTSTNGVLSAWFFLQVPGGRTCLAMYGGTVPLDTWTHVAATYDSATGEGRLYVDGVQVDQASVAAGATLYQSTTPLYFGATPNIAPIYTWFQGQINQVRIWDYAWTVNETPFRFIEYPGLPGTTAQWALDGHLFDLAGGHDGEAVGTIGWVGGCATSTNYGSGTSGPFGVPTLTSDLPVLATTMTVQTNNQSGAAAIGVLAVGLQTADLSVLGGTLLVDPLALLTMPIAPTGGSLQIPIPNQAAFVGLPMFGQLGVFYPGQAQPGFSAGLQWMIGT